MAKQYSMVDALFDLVIFVQYGDILEARKKTRETCGSGERKWGCAIEVAGLRQHPEFKSIRVDGTSARIRFRDESQPDWRWILEGDGKVIAGLNDVSPETLLELDWPLPVRLVSTIAHVPGEDEKTHMKRYTRSLIWGRSDEGKQMKRESAEARKGMERGSYAKSQGIWRDGRAMTGFYGKDEK